MNSNENLMLVYADCNRAREILGRIVGSAERVNEIAMNAAVSASHTGGHVRVFAEIARQLAQTAHRIDRCSSLSRKEIDSATNHTLQIVVENARYCRYVEGLKNLNGTQNRDVVSSRISDIDNLIRRNYRTVFHCLIRCNTYVKTLIQLQNRIFAITNTLGIEAIPLTGSEHATVLSLAESLAHAHDESIELLQVIDHLLLQMRLHLRMTLNTAKDSTDETFKAI